MSVMVHDVTQAQWWAGSEEARSRSGELDKMAFLRLLVTQLKNQNPLDPMDNREFLSQLAQFNALEQMQALNQQMAELTAIQVAAGQELRAISGALAEFLRQQATPAGGAAAGGTGTRNPGGEPAGGAAPGDVAQSGAAGDAPQSGAAGAQGAGGEAAAGAETGVSGQGVVNGG